MCAAMEEAMSGRMSANKAADVHGVPRSTLKDRLSGRVKHGQKPGPRPYREQSEETELSDYVLQAARIGYGKTRKDVLSIAESVAKSKGMLSAGSRISTGWWTRFLERNPVLSLRRGDSTAGVRMDAINAETLQQYFGLLQEVYDKHDFEHHPERIYNMDETGVPLDPRPSKVLAARGQKKVCYRSSGNKSQITVIGCGSASGQVLPPFIIFAAKQLNELWMRDEVVGSRYAVSDSGWIDQELFFYWLSEHFLVNAVAARPLLLLLDGHSSHFEPTTISLAESSEIILFCLPPHTTHECQPLDCSLFGPLKSQWQQVCHDFYQKNPGKVISKLNFCAIFREAWLKAATPANISGGFRKAGVYPFDPKAVPLPAHKSTGEAVTSITMLHPPSDSSSTTSIPVSPLPSNSATVTVPVLSPPLDSSTATFTAALNPSSNSRTMTSVAASHPPSDSGTVTSVATLYAPDSVTMTTTSTATSYPLSDSGIVTSATESHTSLNSGTLTISLAAPHPPSESGTVTSVAALHPPDSMTGISAAALHTPDSGSMATTSAAIPHRPSSSGTMTFAATLCSCSDSGTTTSSATWCTPSGSGEISMTDLPPEKLELFEHRYEENYDLFDDLLYVSWLKHNHPDVP